MAQAGDGDPAEWEILLTAEAEAFLDGLYESDPASHQLVNQAILVLERNGPTEGRPLVDSGQWATWYRTAIPRAEQLYGEYLSERRKETTDE
jgi:hypothetical protein